MEKVIPPDFVLIGEVGLAGEVRSVGQLKKRLIEAKALGFTQALIPHSGKRSIKPLPKGLTVRPVSTVREAFNILF